MQRWNTQKRYGAQLGVEIQKWGSILRQSMVDEIAHLFPVSRLCEEEQDFLATHLKKCSELIPGFQDETLDGFLYCRQVTCPNCGGEAPLFNTCWLSKEAEKQWGVKIITDGKSKNGTVRFETYRVSGGKGPAGEDPNFATVNRAIGQCIHCKHAIDADEIKAQARGESPTGTWRDRLYCVVPVRFQPKFDKTGNPQRYKSGQKKGQIKTEKIRFFRTPNKRDFDALEAAEKQLMANWDRWDEAGLNPTEHFPKGNDMRPIIYGMNRWCDMFMPRQLLRHLTLVEELKRLKPQIITELGHEKGKAVVTYRQFAIDKGLDYNSRQTRWEYTRGIVKGTFGRHDFSLKWTFGEMIFCGPNSGAAWGLSQILDAYKGIASLVNDSGAFTGNHVTIRNGTAAHLAGIEDGTIDLICMDPPYYNNVQYAELSDTASFPVESETLQGFHTKETASAISSIFLSCRKRLKESSEPATWTGFGGKGVQQKIRTAVSDALEEFAPLKLNPVDEMVAGYGRALRVLSEQWPVLDGDEEVGPVRAMVFGLK